MVGLLLRQLLVAAALAAGQATGATTALPPPAAIAGRETIEPVFLYGSGQPANFASLTTRLTFAYFPAAGWEPGELSDVARTAAGILGQCGIRIAAVELVRLEGEPRFQNFHTPASRELARLVPLARPTVYFVADTLQRPAFDAEAIGRANSRTRPELADTVWVTRATRDTGIAVAHELVHVFMNSGAHSTDPGNLMRDETSPENTLLDAHQCDLLRETATRNGLVEPRAKP